MKTEGVVYKIELANSNKFYIGSSKNFSVRKNEHLNDLKKGIHHSKELQELYTDRNSVKFTELFSGFMKDCREIEQLVLDSFFDNLFNTSIKSDYCKIPISFNTRIKAFEKNLNKKRTSHTLSEDTKRKMSETRKGKKNPKSSRKGKESKLSKPVLQLSLDGEIINNFDSVTEAGLNFHKNGQKNISKCLSGAQETAYGYKWRYGEKEEKKTAIFKKRYHSLFITKHNTVSVKFSYRGKIYFLGTFRTQKEALNERNNFIKNNYFEDLINILEYIGE